MAATAAIPTTITATEENTSSCKPLVAATALAFYDDDDDCFCSDKPCEAASAVGLLAETVSAAERPLLRAGDVPVGRTAGRWQQSMGFSLDLDCNVNNITQYAHTYSTFQYTQTDIYECV
jgi:hypothetical protein